MKNESNISYEDLIRDPDLFFRVQNDARRLQAREMWRVAGRLRRALTPVAQGAHAVPAAKLRTASCG